MAPLLEHNQFSKIAADGTIICFEHGLAICEICQFDSLAHQEAEENSSSSEAGSIEEYVVRPTERNSSIIEENSDEVSILYGEDARFVPEEDVQLQGVRMDEEDTPEESPTKPFSDFIQYPCAECRLTWLAGQAGLEAASMHPSHHTVWHHFSGTQRSLVVQAAGACKQDGLPDSRAAVGVYFADESQYNISELLSRAESQTQYRADLQAVIRTLRIIYDQVLPRHRSNVQQHGINNSERARRSARHMRVLVVTNSRFVAQGICKHRPTWLWHSFRCVWTTEDGREIKYSMVWNEIEDLVGLLSKVGVEVSFWLIAEGENWKANQMAWGSLESDNEMIEY